MFDRFWPSNGALNGNETAEVEDVIHNISKEHQLGNEKRGVIGERSLEIHPRVSVNAIALCIAPEEIRGRKLNKQKARQCADTQADLLVADFYLTTELVAFLNAIH